MSALKINNLSFAYKPGEPILNDLSLTVASGEKWAIIGKNGSGKSTLIRCISRLEKIERGSVLIDNRELLDYSPVELAHRCSYVPQATLRLPPPFTVFDYVLMGRYPYCGIPARYSREDRAITAEALELTDTSRFADRLMRHLSGGELQRVFIAGAVAQRTGIMLLDEPVSFLDPMHQEMIQATLERVHAEYGTTLITVTHDINVALRRNTHVLALGDGVPLYAGTTELFLGNPEPLLREVYGISFDSAIIAKTSRSFFVPQPKVAL